VRSLGLLDRSSRPPPPALPKNDISEISKKWKMGTQRYHRIFHSKMVAPAVIALAKIYLVKKIAIYYVARQYGFPLIFRRLLEGMSHLGIQKEQKKIISKHLKSAFRFPNTAHEALSEMNTSAFLVKYFDNLETLSKQLPNFPQLFFTVREVLYSKIPFVGRIVDLFNPKNKK
jgi:hypothetical protein